MQRILDLFASRIRQEPDPAARARRRRGAHL